MKKSVVILLHFIYWFIYTEIVFLVCKVIYEIPDPNNILTIRMVFTFFLPCALIPGFLGFYSSYSFLFPQFLKRKNILGCILSGISVYIAIALIQDIYIFIVPGPIIYRLFAKGWASAIWMTMIFTLIALINGIMGLVLQGFISWYADIKLKEDLNKKNHEMELALVKSQINPHFLFNTINNIDVLIQKDAVKASVYLNKLSDIMRFMLYETKTEKIPLAQELDYIEKYIDLQKIRTSNLNYINYNAEGDAGSLMIAPMLFIPFIENAFKHSENKKIDNAVNIKVVIENGKILFDCENSYSTDTQTKLGHNGLGNELIQKRLNLLYPGKHTLAISNENKLYKIKLIINGN